MDLKPPTTFDEQLNLLQSRNCQISDLGFCKQVLQQIGYYRFSAYFLPFRLQDGNYRQGTNFHTVYRIYEFDRKMRTLLFAAVEQIELYLRSQLSYFHGHHYGPLGYMDGSCYNKRHNHDRFQKRFQNEVQHNRNTLIVQHHLQKYEGKFPIWVAVELFPFGMLSYFYGDWPTADKKEMARLLYGTTYKNLDSWLRCCTDLRNICAHYGRLYNRTFPAIPATPKYLSYRLGRRLFDQIMMVKFLYPDATRWRHGMLAPLSALLEEYREDICLEHIGFPDDWEALLANDSIPIESYPAGE